MSKTRITKDGYVSIKGEYGRTPLYRTALPVFISPSMKEVLKQFGENIEIMDASGTKEIQKNPIPLGHLGINISSIIENQCIVKYDKSPSALNKHDDFSPMNIKIIMEQLDRSRIVDCAVTKLRVRICDNELKKVISDIFPNNVPQTDTFYVEFESALCESELDREVWESVEENQNLTQIGFKRTLLHCINLVDEKQTLLVKKRRRFYYINWNPTPREIKEGTPEHQSPEEIAHALVESLGKHGFVKKYEVGVKNKLILKSMN